MSLESGDIEELRTKPVVEDTIIDLNLPSTLVDLSDAEMPSKLATATERLDIEEPEEHEAEFASEITSADLTQPDSLIDENDAGSPSTLAAVPERFEIKTTEESVTEFEDEITKTILHLLGGFIDAGSPSGTGTVLEHLENGECEESKTEEPAAEVASADLNKSDSLTDSNDAVNLSDLATVTDFSAMGPTEKATKEGDHVEELVVDTSVGDATEVSPLPREEFVQDGVGKVQDTSENAFQNNVSESGSMLHNTDGGEAGEGDHDLDKAALHSILEGETEYLSSSKQLPSEVGKNVIQLQCESSAPDAPNGVCLVNIVGTAHVSKASCEEVQALIRHVKPEVVFLELCSSRTNILLPSKREVPTFSSMLESYKKREMNLFGLLYCWFLAKVGEKLEILPGTEFRVAYEEAVRCGASVSLGDRPIQITLKRTWGKMSFCHKAKFLCSMLTASFNLPSADEFHALMEKMEQSDELTIMIQELSKTFPTLLETLVVERDLYMVESLRTVARQYSSVVAVVGRGHLSGIANHWKEDINVDKLLALPAKNPVSRMWLWGTVALGVGGIVAGVHLLRRR